MRFVYFSLLFVFISGCTNVSLNYQAKRIELKNSELNHAFDGKTLYSTQKNLSQASIEYQVFQTTSNGILVYEYARLKTAYKFKFNYPYILRQIFDAQNVKTEQNKNDLGFFTITLKDQTTVYAIAKTSTKKSLSLLYGFSKQNFEALMNNQPLNKHKADQLAPDDAIKTQWNQKLILTGVLLENLGGGIPLR